MRFEKKWGPYHAPAYLVRPSGRQLLLTCSLGLAGNGSPLAKTVEMEHSL